MLKLLLLNIVRQGKEMFLIPTLQKLFFPHFKGPVKRDKETV